MTDLEILNRKIQLKQQAIAVIKEEIIDLQLRLALMTHKNRLESQIAKEYDSVISRKLDCITCLLED